MIEFDITKHISITPTHYKRSQDSDWIPWPKDQSVSIEFLNAVTSNYETEWKSKGYCIIYFPEIMPNTVRTDYARTWRSVHSFKIHRTDNNAITQWNIKDGWTHLHATPFLLSVPMVINTDS